MNHRDPLLQGFTAAKEKLEKVQRIREDLYALRRDALKSWKLRSILVPHAAPKPSPAAAPGYSSTADSLDLRTALAATKAAWSASVDDWNATADAWNVSAAARSRFAAPSLKRLSPADVPSPSSLDVSSISA